MTHPLCARLAAVGLAVCSGFAAARAEVLASGWIPASILPQGQVCLLAAPGGWRLDVVLHTRFLDRAVRSIVEKETANWPKDHPDASAYLEGLALARAEVKQQSGGRGREVLKISLILTPETRTVEWSTGDVGESEGHWIVKNPTVLRSFEPSRDYLLRNAGLILQDSLRISEDAARDLVAGPAGGDA
jgi:hypothetical protein